MFRQQPIRAVACLTVLVFALSGITRTACAQQSAAGSVPAPPPIVPDEPLAGTFSLERTARYLDTAAIHWQQTHRCGTCHTNFAYLLARPALAVVVPPPTEVRAFFEEMVERRWPTDGPRWDAEVVVAAATLAFHDRHTTGRLHPLSRRALDRMWTLQRPDGGFNWLKCGWPPAESDDHYGATLAALGAGVAPDGYARTESARKGLAGIRRFLASNQPPSLHHKAMVLWASCYVPDLMTETQRRQTLEELLDRQLPDGGWAIAGLLDGWKEHRRKDNKPQDVRTSDGYATGFVAYVARQAGKAADDPRLRRAVTWLKTHQRASGRWFTRSPTKDSHHYISNLGTVFAVLALDSCGEIQRR